MSGTVERSAKSGRRTLFYRDLASPISSHRGNDFSPDSGLGDWPVSPEINPSFAEAPQSQVEKQQQLRLPQNPASSSWWSPVKSGGGDQESKGKGSPVDGVILSGALITLPPPREVARPELQRNTLPLGGVDEEEWVTVYGFSPCDTNMVLREFEKCGAILRHVPAPEMLIGCIFFIRYYHLEIDYHNRYDAQKALLKNGTQINSVLIVGVKAVDPSQRGFLNEKPNGGSQIGFMVSLPSQAPTRKGAAHPPPSAAAAAGAIASPAKSVVSKIMDLMFGI
ncbi:unnamed protein product [Spirodela intermedia]|uniref:RRM Nup35-type domain-containing protein n=1 Tax=Spirodela intermedia TaxID=51605 RepID=A0A7I8J8G3_SPIIN|nr:unnamed protein product [Spirodela intermedia]CAA6666035.1 unnamed protein product [Spirodela intermedia]